MISKKYLTELLIRQDLLFTSLKEIKNKRAIYLIIARCDINTIIIATLNRSRNKWALKDSQNMIQMR